ncbi:MAG TPA: hypothetical protein VGG70_12520 [Candidatus Cybelea sp.]
MRRLPFALMAIATALLVAACSGGGTTPSTGTSTYDGRLANSGVSHPKFLRLFRTPPHPPPRRHKITGADIARARAAGWQPLSSVPAFPNGPQTELLLTDGTVAVFDGCSSTMYRLAPDNTGSYVNGTWSSMPSLPNGYAPLYFASVILPDGKMIVNGGEYQACQGAETAAGAIFDPVANKWTSVTGPSGWSEIGDASGLVLSNGTYMLGNCCYNTQALYNEASGSWTQIGNGKADTNSEEGWTLLPSGNVVSAEVFSEPGAQYYDPVANDWVSAGTLPNNLTNCFEMGPQVLTGDGTVFIAGADQYTATYNPGSNSWKSGPNFPVVNGQQVDIADGPATLLTNGKVMMAASPGCYNTPTTFLMYKKGKLKTIAGPPNEANDSSYNIRLLMLPTGQVLENDGSSDMEVYTSKGHAMPKARPRITYVPSTLSRGSTYTAQGVLFNGVSQTNFYGDDVSQSTNFPIVRITNTGTGHVFYAKTHGFSYMGVASTSSVSTQFDVPSGADTGASTLVVVANGTASKPVNVTVQ